jgi:D-amino-acid dehydrogenase
MAKHSTSPGHVVVVGAGIVGLGTAWALARDGWRVTVVDRDQPGSGASGGNGAQLSYSYVQPLADPGIWAQLPQLLLARDSPLRFRLQADPAQWAWLTAFLLACRGSVSRQTTGQLLKLAASSRQIFETMQQEEGLVCDFSASGKLVLYTDAASLERARRQMDIQQSLGGALQRLVSPDACVHVEPALAQYARHMAGGIYTPSECAVDCEAVCQALHQRLSQHGVRFWLGQPVRGWVSDAQQVRAIQLEEQHLEADAFVLAAGTGSVALARHWGVRLPIYPLKGYSITLPLTEDQRVHAPRVSITDLSRKMVVARLGNRLRVAGMVELVGENRAIDPARIALLQSATRQIFPGLSCREADIQPWAGLRPATPRGLPWVGRHPALPANLCLNTGHGALGLTLSMGSAEIVRQTLRHWKSGPAGPRLAVPAACSA